MLRIRPAVKTSESTRERSRGNLLRGVLGSGVFALVVAAVCAHLSLAGVIDIFAARIALCLGWLAAVVGVLISETLCEQSVKHRIIYTLSTGLIVGVTFIALDAWTVGYKANQQAGLSKKDILDTIKDGLSADAKLSENLQIKVLRKNEQKQKETTPESAEAKSESEKQQSIQPKSTEEPDFLTTKRTPPEKKSQAQPNDSNNQQKLSSASERSVQNYNAPQGIIIGGGTVNNPTVNNYGPKKMPELSSYQQNLVSARFQGFQGRSVFIDIDQPTEDMHKFGMTLESALATHMRVTLSEGIFSGGCAIRPRGISFMVGVNRLAEAKLLWNALVEIGIQDGDMPYCSRSGEPDEFHIRIFRP
jgi:hypothetical protein